MPCVARRSCAGACETVVPTAGPPGCWDRRVVRPSAVFGVNSLCAGAWVLIEFERFLWAGGLFYNAKTMGFKKIENAAYSICMGFNR